MTTADQKTEKELAAMEKYLTQQFKTAEKEILSKSKKYFKKFDKQDKEKKKQLKAGEITQEEYETWKKNKIMYGEHWNNLVSNIQNELANVNQTAVDYVNGKVPQIYAVNYNSVAEHIENSPIEGYSFELIDSNTVYGLVNRKEIMLPHKDLDKTKDKAWNAKKVNSCVLQGILQGSSMDEIAKNLAKVTGESNGKAAIRNARTMVTGAENAGRQDGMNAAAEDGVQFKKVWIATTDSRTRDSHKELDGQEVDPDKKFEVNNHEIEFPGDWHAEACEVYNCRCTLGTKILGFKKIKKPKIEKPATKAKTKVEEKPKKVDPNEIVKQILNTPINELPPDKYAAVRQAYIECMKRRGDDYDMVLSYEERCDVIIKRYMRKGKSFMNMIEDHQIDSGEIDFFNDAIKNLLDHGTITDKADKKDKQKKQNKIVTVVKKFIDNTFKPHMEDYVYDELINNLSDNPIEQAWLKRLRNRLTWDKVDADCHFNPANKLLRWRINGERDKDPLSTLFHEFGHAISNMFNLSSYGTSELDNLHKYRVLSAQITGASITDEFLEAMRSDKVVLMKIIGDREDKNNREQLNMLTSGPPGFQDFLSGIAGNKSHVRSKLRWTHSEEYYTRKYKCAIGIGHTDDNLFKIYKKIGKDVESVEDMKTMMRDYDTAEELWANMNDAYVNGGEPAKFFERHCPNAFTQFKKMMEASEYDE